MIRIGVIGAGVIGQRIAQIAREHPSGTVISGFLTRGGIPECVEAESIPVATTLDEFLKLGHDVVIESAGQAALIEHGPQVLGAGKILVPASVGSFAHPDILNAHLEACKYSGGKIRLASGAISGLDALAAARKAGLRRVRYVGVMAGMVEKDALPAEPRTDRVKVFAGTAREAALKFPKNANLTLTIAMAGIGMDATEVELYRDASAPRNVHELQAEGDFGSMKIVIEGVRISPSSPSSHIVPASLFNAAAGVYYLPVS